MKNLQEFGRSMVEMLGVLVIIGILSIVGISGYRKAINKAHANELMDLAMRVWNEAIARDTLAGGYDKLITNCRVCLREIGTGSCTSKRSLGWEKPSWTAASFTIMAAPCGINTDFPNPTIILYKTPTNVCEEIKSMTTDSPTNKARLLPETDIDVTCTPSTTINDSVF